MRAREVVDGSDCEQFRIRIAVSVVHGDGIAASMGAAATF